MKLLISGLVVAVCTLAGFGRAAGLNRRVRQLDAALLLCEKLQSCLQYERRTSAELVSWLSGQESLRELTFLRRCAALLEERKPFPEAWRQSVEESGLAADDRGLLLQIGEILGGSRAESQLGELAVLRSLLEENRAASGAERQQKSRLYHSLGILGGLGLAILLW